jgi:mRNA-degrading endonuclease RelE of RelBE toxin-antitoxin system
MGSNYIVLFSRKFAKLFDKLSDANKKLLLKKIRLLEDDPFYPSLRCKQLKVNPGCID